MIAESGGLAAFARRIKKADTQVSAFAGENPRKGIGNKIAEEIEIEFGKPPGWLDAPPEDKDIAEITKLLHSLPDDMQDTALASVKQMLQAWGNFQRNDR